MGTTGAETRGRSRGIRSQDSITIAKVRVKAQDCYRKGFREDYVEKDAPFFTEYTEREDICVSYYIMNSHCKLQTSSTLKAFVAGDAMMKKTR